MRRKSTRTTHMPQDAPIVEQTLYAKSDGQGFDYLGRRIDNVQPNTQGLSETEIASLDKNVLGGGETPLKKWADAPRNAVPAVPPRPGQDAMDAAGRTSQRNLDQSHTDGVIGTGDNVGVRNVPGGTVRTEKSTRKPGFSPDEYAHEDPDVKVFPRGSMQLNIGESICLQPGNDCS